MAADDGAQLRSQDGGVDSDQEPPLSWIAQSRDPGDELGWGLSVACRHFEFLWGHVTSLFAEKTLERRRWSQPCTSLKGWSPGKQTADKRPCSVYLINLLPMWYWHKTFLTCKLDLHYVNRFRKNWTASEITEKLLLVCSCNPIIVPLFKLKTYFKWKALMAFKS